MFRNFFTYTLTILLCFILATFCPKANAQNINGIITNANGRLSGATIKNTVTNAKVISNERGTFSIQAQKGDTIITLMPDYKSDTLIYNNQDYLIIRLKKINTMLRQVDITDTLSNPLTTYNRNKVEYKDIFWKGNKSHMISFPANIGLIPSIGIAVNIDKLYSALSKQGNDARRLQRNLLDDYQEDIVDQHFTKALVSKVTGYEGDKLGDFMVKYRPSYEFASKASTYDMIAYIRKEAKLSEPGLN